MSRHEVVICTRNRPDDLRVALESLRDQVKVPDLVTVVDSSDGPGAADVVSNFESDRLPLRYFHTPAGLPLQRNYGTRQAVGDVIHFIDDDVVLAPTYIEELAKTFEDSGPQLVGAGGVIESHGTRRPRLWWRIALMDSRRQGVILPSGVNIVVTDVERETEVMWLSGCSMSYRRWIFEHISFDEALSGYALMEDVDFSSRASRLGRLVVNPRARLEHTVSDVERWDQKQRTMVGIHRRGWFVEKNMARWNMVCFVWSVLAGAAVNAAIGLGTLSRWRTRVALWQLSGLVGFASGRR